MPTTHIDPTRRRVYQRRHHRGSVEPIHYVIHCPTCGDRALLGLRYAAQSDGQPAAATVLRFRCINQMARSHQSPTNAELLTLQ